MSNLKFTRYEHWSALEEHLGRGEAERFGFAFTRLLANTDDGPILEVVGVDLIEDVHVNRGETGWLISDRRIDRVHNSAQEGGYGLVEFHCHRLGPPAFSNTDESAIVPMAAYVLDLLPNRPYGAGVYSGGRVHVENWVDTGAGLQRDQFRAVTLFGDHLRIINTAGTNGSGRLERQSALLGEHGRDTLQTLRVALVGAGGTGSHIALGLAYLGTPEVMVLDDDIVELTNLNRLVTADLADLGAPKNSVARRRMRGIDPHITVTALPGLSPDGHHPELEDVDILIGCVDHDGPRDRLNQIAVDMQIPYIDIATGVDSSTDPPALGGRVVIVTPDGPCLHCLHELDPEEVGRWAKDPVGQALDRQHGYGTGDPDPSVVHLNGLAAHAALAELVSWISGTRQPAQYLDIDLSGHLRRADSASGTLIAPRQPKHPVSGCLACAHRQ